jgi:hypothetical protein
VPGGGGGGSGPEATPGPVAPGPSVPIVTLGGIVTVRCVGTKIEVVGISLGLGFLLDKAERGPAKNVKATLLSLLHKTEVTAHCDKGNVVKNVKESER